MSSHPILNYPYGALVIQLINLLIHLPLLMTLFFDPLMDKLDLSCGVMLQLDDGSEELLQYQGVTNQNEVDDVVTVFVIFCGEF